jgi:hypothetical protein
MTRKDYVAFARALNCAKRDDMDGLELLTWKNCVDAIARVCASDNGNFDRERFYAACEGTPLFRRDA